MSRAGLFILCGGDCPVHCRGLRNIPSLRLSDASNTPSLCLTTKTLKYLVEAELAPHENLWALGCSLCLFLWIQGSLFKCSSPLHAVPHPCQRKGAPFRKDISSTHPSSTPDFRLLRRDPGWPPHLCLFSSFRETYITSVTEPDIFYKI